METVVLSYTEISLSKGLKCSVEIVQLASPVLPVIPVAFLVTMAIFLDFWSLIAGTKRPKLRHTELGMTQVVLNVMPRLPVVVK
jgi:hypothetical protein